MVFSIVQLHKIMPYAKARAETHFKHLAAAMAEFDINTERRMAAFLAQLAHESGELRYTSEIANGSAYEGRKDLGNILPGDGVKFKGHGFIQITGRDNHRKCGEYFGMDFEANPMLLTLPEWASRSAGWFWDTHDLNRLADVQDLKMITKKINGGFNGIKERQAYYDKALSVFESSEQRRFTDKLH